MKLPPVLRRSPVVDTYRALKQPKWEGLIWRDLLASAKAWREVPSGNPTGPVRVLIATWRDDIFDCKITSIVARMLAAEGVQVEAAIWNWKLSRTKRLLRVLSGAKVSMAPTPQDELSAADRKMLETGSYDEVMGWEVEGIPLGPLVMSSSIRELRNTSPDRLLADRSRLLRIGRVALRNLRAAEQMLDARPGLTHVVLTEPGYVDTGPLFRLALARGLQVIYPGMSFRDDAMLFKRYVGELDHVDLLLTVDRGTMDRMTQEPWGEAEDTAVEQAFSDRYGGRWEMTKTFQATTESCGDAPIHPRRREDRPLVVVYCHVLWDATGWAGDDLFDDYADWLKETVRVAIETEDVDWVIKTHPANAFRSSIGDVDGCAEARLIEEHFGELPPHMTLLLPSANITALDCYQRADVGVTVRGMPGFEMACFGKRVLTAGTGPYDRLGFTDDFETPETYLDALRALGQAGPVESERSDRARRYALTLFRERPTVFESIRLDFAYTKGGPWSPLGRNLHPVPGASYDELRQLARWILHSTDRDWITAWHR